MDLDLDVLVIGGGQAGLAAGYFLRDAGLSFAIYDAFPRVGDAWRRRYDSLVLFTSRQYSALPGLAMPGDPGGYPTKDEMAAYLETYARHFDLPVVCGAGVARLEAADGGFAATLSTGDRIRAGAVIVATGAFQRPVVPDFARRLDPAVVQLTASTYRRPAQLPAGPVLVAGDGATGRQVALELAPGHPVLLAGGRKRNTAPQRVLGRDIFWWLDKTGLVRADKETVLGRILRARDPFPGGGTIDDASLHRAGIAFRPRAVDAVGRTVRFADGSAAEVASVIWAVGYRDDTAWNAVPGALEGSGRVIEDRGMSPVAGLYYVGRSWQNNRGSAILPGVGEDARGIVAQAVRHVREDRVRSAAAAGRAASPVPAASAAPASPG